MSFSHKSHALDLNIRTTATAALYDIVNSLDKKQHCAALFVDLSKAFDIVDLNILLNTLLFVGFDDSSYSWLKSYLSGRILAAVVADGFKSSPQIIDKSVPPGSISGPLLFTMYTNIYFPTQHNNVHFYVDDTTLYGISSTANQAFSRFLTWLLVFDVAYDGLQTPLFNLILVLNSKKTKWPIHMRAYH